MDVGFMAPLMFVMLVVFMLLGYPVAFALAANGLLFGLIGIELGLLKPELLQAIPDRVFGIMINDTLLAIPFFTFMGLILERSGMAEDLLDTVGQLFGRMRGGLAYAVILVGALLAATTGVVAASVIAMGLISLPVMLRYGYDRRFAGGTIAASGTLAQIIPPSLVLIVLADQLGVSVGDMYSAALIPALLLAGLYIVYVFVRTFFQADLAPALPPEARTLRGSALLLRLLTSAVPPLVLIFLVLGTIFLGIATPTEGGAMGAVGALALAALRRRLDKTVLTQALESTVKLSTFVMFILIGSTVFALVFRGVDGDLWVEQLLTALPGGVYGFLIMVMLLVFALGFVLDFFEIAFILVPLLAPVAEKLGIDLVWFGVLLSLTMQTSFLTPPLGFSLFYLRSVAPATVTTNDIYRGVIPFVALQLVMVGWVMLMPQLAVPTAADAPQAQDTEEVLRSLGLPTTDPSTEETPSPEIGQAHNPQEPAHADDAQTPAAPAGQEEVDPAVQFLEQLAR